MYFIRNLRAISDRLKFGRQSSPYPGSLVISPRRAERVAGYFLHEIYPRIGFATRVIIVDEEMENDCHVASHSCSLLPTVIELAVHAEQLVIRGFHFNLSRLSAISSALTVISLCNVHFPDELDVLGLLSRLPALTSAYLHYVTCAVDFQEDLVLPSSLREVMLTSDHATLARHYGGIRLQDHFLRWAIKNPKQIPGLYVFAMWEVEDCMADTLLEFWECLMAESKTPSDVHITIQDGHTYAGHTLRHSTIGKRFARHVEQLRIHIESEVDHSLPELIRLRLSDILPDDF